MDLGDEDPSSHHSCDLHGFDTVLRGNLGKEKGIGEEEEEE